MKKFLFVLLTFFFVFQNHAEARRHRHRIKGLFFANQILNLTGTMKDNGKEILEYSGVKPGDLLETGENSHAVIRLSGLALFELGPNTKLKLTRITDRTDTKFEVLTGRVLCLFHHTGVHQVLLPHSTLALHGTTFFVEVGPGDNDPDKVCLCDGKIQVTLAEDEEDEPPKSKNPKVRHPLSTTDVTSSKAGNGATNSAANANGPSISAAGGPANTASAATKASPAPSAPLVLMTGPSPSGSAPTAPGTAAAMSSGTAMTAASPSPAPAPKLRDLQVVSHNEHKQFEVTDDGITVKDEGLLDLHSDKEIQDMESLYNLP